MVEADLGDESYGASGAGDDDNGDFGAEGEFEGFDQYGEGQDFDDSMGAAGGSGAAADGKDDQLRCYLTASTRGNPILWDRLQNSYYRIKTSQPKLNILCMKCLYHRIYQKIILNNRALLTTMTVQ